MTGRYAESTGVSTDKSKAEIERILTRYGADQFLYGWDQESAVIGFRAHDRMVRINLPLPDRNAKEFTETPSRRWERTPEQARAAYEQGVRQRWRSLALVIKAKLEAVEAGIATFEEEFLSYTMLPDGSRVGDHLLPQLADTYATGKMPPMLPGRAAPQ